MHDDANLSAAEPGRLEVGLTSVFSKYVGQLKTVGIAWGAAFPGTHLDHSTVIEFNNSPD